MDKKVNFYFTNYSPIGSITQQNFYFVLQCNLTKACYKSPVIYGGRPNMEKDQAFFWQVSLNQDQNQVVCQMISVGEDYRRKTDQVISEVTLHKIPNDNEQKQVTFYRNSKKIAILNYIVKSQTKKEVSAKNIFSQINQSQLHPNLNPKKSKNQQNLDTHDEDFQNQRYLLDYTPSYSNHNSFFKFQNYSEQNGSQILGDLDESLIQKRHEYQDNHSLLVESDLQLKNNELSSLQKWLKKLKNIDTRKFNKNSSVIELNPIIPTKYLELEETSDTKLQFRYTRFNQNSNQNLVVKLLRLDVIDNGNKQTQESLFQCNFSVSNKKEQSKSSECAKQMRFNNLVVEVPPDKNVELKMMLEDIQKHQNVKKVSGIFMKDSLQNEGQIPLFAEDEKVFATLGYKSKKIHNASVQCLPSLQDNPVDSPTNNDFSLETRSPTLTSIIRQRKLNNKIIKRNIHHDFKIKKYSYDQSQDKQLALFSPNQSPLRTIGSPSPMQASKISIQQNSEFSSQNEFHRSNTDDMPFLQLQSQGIGGQNQTERSQENESQSAISRLKHSFLSSPKKNVNLSPSRNSNNLKNGQNYHLRSTNLTDLQEQQSQDQESYFKDNGFNIISKESKSTKKNKKKPLKQNKNKKEPLKIDQYTKNSTIIPRISNKEPKFITQISSITVIMYHAKLSRQQQSGRFLILKSDIDEIFITETLFTNHLNSNWKNKSYKFTSSLIQIAVYERTGYSSQCQNKLCGSITIKIRDLLGAIKQNFYRQQILVNGQPVGTIVLIYDIFMQKDYLADRQYNRSEMLERNISEHKTTKSINKRYISNQTIQNREEISSLHREKLINRRRSKTLECDNNSFFLPSIEKNSSTRSRIYVGGKNIKIGRAQRFLGLNMAETLGQI